MITQGGLDQHPAFFKRDSARRIDRVIDYFGDPRDSATGACSPRPSTAADRSCVTVWDDDVLQR